LDFALGGGVAFLDFGGIVEGVIGVFFGRAGGSADAIASGTTADEEDEVAGIGTTTEDVFTRRGGDDGSDFHAFSGVVGVINFGDFSGGEADLVSVRGVATSGFLTDFTLGEFAGDGFVVRGAWVGSAGDTHGLVDVGAATQGVANTTAKAGGGSAEGLDLGGVVVSFVFELDEPFFG